MQSCPQRYPGWLRAWWHAFGNGGLEIHAVRDGGRLVAVAPMIRSCGSLAAARNVHTPGFEILAENGRYTAEVLGALLASRPRRLSLPDLDSRSGTVCTVRRLAHATGYRVLSRPVRRSPYLDIAQSWAEYQSSRSRNLRASLRRARKRALAKGWLTVDIVTGGENLDALLHEAYRIEASGWKGSRGSAIRCNPHTRRFYTELAHWAAEEGFLRLALLRLNDHAIAMSYVLQAHGVAHFLKAGYDQAFACLSPSHLLAHAVFRRCFEAGLSRIEFHGDAEPYKLRWMYSTNQQVRLEAFAPSTSGCLSEAGYRYLRPITARFGEAGHRYLRPIAVRLQTPEREEAARLMLRNIGSRGDCP
ncbi:MAG: GNAT family N-acetyltransferase [Gammaproteobacteria bacterium]